MDGSRGTEHSDEEEPTWWGGSGGLTIPLGGIRRGTDPQDPGVGRQQRLLGTQVDESVRKEICEGHLGGGVHAVLGKITIKQLPGDF